MTKSQNYGHDRVSIIWKNSCKKVYSNLSLGHDQLSSKQNPSECKWSESNVIPGTKKVDYTKALRAFREWAITGVAPRADHRMFISG